MTVSKAVILKHTGTESLDFGPFKIPGKAVTIMFSLGSSLDAQIIGAVPYMIVDKGDGTLAEKQAKLEGKIPHPECKVPGFIWDAIKSHPAVKFWTDTEKIRVAVT